MRFLLVTALWMFGSIAPFTERGTTDFDTFLQILNPYGEWKEARPGHWQYFPLAGKSYLPMSSGQWIYTDFGWYWLGTDPFSWACDHYGVWKLGEDGVWSWSPDPLWQSFKVDFRSTKGYIGWRSSAINQMGDFVEKEEQRFAKPAEWIFVTVEKFKGPITPADVITGPAAAKILEESAPCDHTFVSWRDMDRAGPDPVNILPKDRVKRVEDLKDNEPQIVTPVLWSLPTYWTHPPLDAKPDDLYTYRPKLYQDIDGMQRRVLIWQRPEEKTKATEKLNQVLQGHTQAESVVETPPQPVVVPAPAPTPAPSTPPPASMTSNTTASTPDPDRWKAKK